jgi:hypothetical protein
MYSRCLCYKFQAHRALFRQRIFLKQPTALCGGTRKRSCLRHYATSRKVAVSSHYEVDFSSLPNPASRSMTPGSTQPVTEMSTRKLRGGQRATGS